VSGPWDVVIVGGGHNGLVCAAYLARAGQRVLVIEQRPVAGGPLLTQEIAPGFLSSTGADVIGPLRPEVVRDLELTRHGLELLPIDPTVVAIGDDSTTLRLWRTVEQTQEELRRHSARDAAAYPTFHEFLMGLAEALDPILLRAPPDVQSPTWADQIALLRRALRLRRRGMDAFRSALRLPVQSLHRLLDEWFETDLLKATLAFDALIGTCRGPWSPGTAFGLLRHYAGVANGQGWAFVKGGMGSFARAVMAAAGGAGATIRTGTRVRRIMTEDGRATGVELTDGERIHSKVVVSNADPKRTFLDLVDPAELDADFLSQVRAYNTNGCVAKVNIALEELPRFPGWEDGRPPPSHVRIAPSMEFIERAYDDAKYGGFSQAPVLDVFLPSVVDPSVAPRGKHVMSVLAQYAPYHLREGTWNARREDLAGRVMDRLEERLPGIRARIRTTEVLTPLDIERTFGMTGGHIYHGEMTLDQLFVMRPVPGWARYRTPIDALYLCGSGAHPGGGITGAPGYNAARAIMSDLKRIPRGAVAAHAMGL